MNPANELFLMTTNLSQLRGKGLVIQLFIEGLNHIFPDHIFEWDGGSLKNASGSLNVCTRMKSFGFIEIQSERVPGDELMALLQNAVQMLAVSLEKLEQDEYISNQKLHLQYLVDEKTKELAALNEGYAAINEELVAGNKLLQESKIRYQCISRLSSDFSYSCIVGDNGFEVDWISDAFFSISGYNCEELAAQGCWLFTAHPDDRDWITSKLSGLDPGSSSHDEFRLVSKTGDIHVILNRIECIADSSVIGGKRFFGSVIDISDRKRAEQAIQKKTEELTRSNQLMIGRELRMIELKMEVNKLLSASGEAEKYKIFNSSQDK